MPIISRVITIGKAIMRNGYDAHIINAPLQKIIYEATQSPEFDLACACDLEALKKIFPHAEGFTEDEAMAIMTEDDLTIYFYRTEVDDAVQPERVHRRLTSRMFRALSDIEIGTNFHVQSLKRSHSTTHFLNTDKGVVSLVGIPSQSLNHNYLLAIKALRYAANYDIPIEPQSWLAIIQARSRILDYVATRDIMDEWRKVTAESMARFVRLLFDTQLLHGIMPEVAALACVEHGKKDNGEIESVFDNTITAMYEYPTDGFAFDWYGTFAMLLHNVGKLYAAELYDGTWTFYQHHRVGANIARKIMRRLNFSSEDIDLIAHLIRNHVLFNFMLTDSGLRHFASLPETDRLIAMCAADLRASHDSYTSFNHNMKYLGRAKQDKLTTEPLLNGNEIMEHINLPPGPKIGLIRDALLKAQIDGDVTNMEEALAFIEKYDG